MKLMCSNAGSAFEIPLDKSTNIINTNTLKLEISPDVADKLGVYNLLLTYDIPNAEFKNGIQECAVDRNAFEIVARSADADRITTVSLTSDMAVIVRGPKGEFSDLKPDEVAILQQPAIDAAATANTAASNANTKASAAQTAAENANSKATAANTAAQNANSKASAANTAAQGANDATSALTSKLQAVDTKMQQVDQKVTGYETALDNISEEVDTKIQAVTLKTTQLETAVDDKIQEIETEAVAWRNQETSRQTAEEARQEVYNTKLDKIDPITGLEVRELIFSSHHYGIAMRRWNIHEASPIGEAVGDIATLRDLPQILGLGCYLVQKDFSRRKLDPTDHYRFADDGTSAALDGSMGDYMWGWNKKWYYATWIEGDYEYEAASLKPIRGRQNYVIPVGSTSALGVGVVDRETAELVSVINDSPRYRGGNNSAANDGQFNTLLGRGASAQSQETYGAYARKKGVGWEAYMFTHAGIIGALTRIIMGTRHLQTDFNSSKDANGLYQGGLGKGVTDAGAWWSGTEAGQFGYSPFLPTSVGVELGDNCGVVSYDVLGIDDALLATVEVPVFFGLKNFYGVMNRWERGLIISKDEDGYGDVYVVKNTHQEYSVNSTDGLIKVATTPPDNGYIKQLSMQNLCHKPISLGGSSATYYADYQYNNNTSGLRGSAVGGHASYGGNAGPESLDSIYGVSITNAYYGSPLCESQEAWDTTPVWVG